MPWFQPPVHSARSWPTGAKATRPPHRSAAFSATRILTTDANHRTDLTRPGPIPGGLRSLLIRLAKLEDADVLAAIIAEVAHERTIGPEPPVEIAARAERFREAIQAEAPNETWVLEKSGRIVGYANSRKTTNGVLVLEMAILPDGRGQGGGRALLQAVLEHARECAAHKIELESWGDNAR